MPCAAPLKPAAGATCRSSSTWATAAPRRPGPRSALDRLGRSLRDLLLLLDDLAASGCSVISLMKSIDLSTGRLLVHLIASLAGFERELILDRVRAGLARVKATGRTRSGRAVWAGPGEM